MKEWENSSIKWKVRIKKLIYMLCFAFLCLIDQRIKTGSGLDGVIESFRDLSYIVIAILVLSHYRLQDFRKYWFLYVEWIIFSIIGGSLFVWKGEAIAMFPSDRVVLAINLLLWGIAIIQTLVGIIAEKRRLDFIHKPFACIWLLMMAGMCILRRDIYWPEAYLIAYGTFYLTDYSEEERKLLFQGMLNGILLGFFLMQGWCFVFRPYDIIRYSGVYSNANHNVVFYLIVLAAVFTKLLYAYRNRSSEEKASKISRIFLRVAVRIWYWFLAGAVLDFILLTIGRTGYLVAVILLVAMALMRWRVVEKRWYLFALSILKSGAMILLCFGLMFPVVFEAVRYLPPVFHHPVWFWGEWNEDRVQSWQPWDSENYVEFEDLLEMIVNRVEQILEQQEISCAVEGVLLASTDVSAVAREIPPKPANVTDLQWERYQEVLAEGYGIDLKEFNNAGAKRSILVRYNIYRYYLHHLNWTGHPENEQGFQMVSNYWVGHAHNIYLQWGTDFGIPVMVLFIILILWTIGHLISCFHVTGDPQYAGYLLFSLVPCLFGMLEFCWGAGSLPIALMFFTWGRVMCRVR
mgnify:CR=1 FL=1